MTKQYFCDCEKRCKGRFKEVSRSTYQRHASFREPPIPAAPSTRGGPGGPLINSQSGTREQPASDPQQTHRGTNLAGTGAAATPVWVCPCKSILGWLSNPGSKQRRQRLTRWKSGGSWRWIRSITRFTANQYWRKSWNWEWSIRCQWAWGACSWYNA